MPKTPSYRLHKRSGRAVVTLSDSVTKARRDVYLGDYGTTHSKALYHKTVAGWEAAGRRLGSRPHPSTSTRQAITHEVQWLIVAGMVRFIRRRRFREGKNWER